jgi:site-specific DNA recombinase
MDDNVANIVGYVRVSSDEQAEKGVSLDAQAERIMAWAEARGSVRDAVRVHRDEGLSGGRMDNRPGLAAAIEEACSARGSTLVVYSLSRLSRDMGDTIALTKRLDRSGVELVSLTESLDMTTAGGELQGLVVSMFSQHERKVGIERTLAAMTHKRSRGEFLGQLPYGKMLPEGATRNADGTYPPNVVLVDDPAELAALEVLDGLHASGLGPRAIARKMTERGFPTKSGRPWAESTVRTLTAKRSPHAPRQAHPGEDAV